VRHAHLVRLEQNVAADEHIDRKKRGQTGQTFQRSEQRGGIQHRGNQDAIQCVALFFGHHA
jgi:hypothetical protein